MAYDHTQYEVVVALAADAAATGEEGDGWSPGYIPPYVRAFSVAAINAVGAAGEVELEKVTLGGAAGSGTVISTITVTNGLSQGSIIYEDGLNTKLNPGEEIIVNISNACAAGDLLHCVALVEPSWETPGNDTSMTATA